jgi:membrane fusion protein (multidrug efflux system)
MKKILSILGVLLLLAIGVWWWRQSRATEAAEEPKPVAAVQVAPATLEPIGRVLTAYGIVDPAASGTTAVTLAYDCVVRSVLAAAGTRVSAGETLLLAGPTLDARLQLDSARGVAALAARSLASLRERYDLRLATGDDLRAAEQADQDARLKRESLEARGLGAAAQVAAPIAGIVVQLNAQPGATVPAGTALATIAAPGRLEARLGLEISDAAAVKTGQPVTLTAINRPAAAAVRGRVALVNAVADGVTGAVEVRVPVAETSGWLPGERVRAEIEIESKTALVIPRSAVLPDDDQEVVYTVAGGKAAKHSVQVGIVAGEKAEVSGGGLKPGDNVVIQGNYELEDGMDVQVGDPAAAGDAGEKSEAKP